MMPKAKNENIKFNLQVFDNQNQILTSINIENVNGFSMGSNVTDFKDSSQWMQNEYLFPGPRMHQYFFFFRSSVDLINDEEALAAERLKRR